MGVVIEICKKYPGGRPRIRVTDIRWYCSALQTAVIGSIQNIHNWYGYTNNNITGCFWSGVALNTKHKGTKRAKSLVATGRRGYCTVATGVRI
jgi:hypothetical protein